MLDLVGFLGCEAEVLVLLEEGLVDVLPGVRQVLPEHQREDDRGVLRLGHRYAQLVRGVPQAVLDLLLGHCHESGVSLLVSGGAVRKPRSPPRWASYLGPLTMGAESDLSAGRSAGSGR